MPFVDGAWACAFPAANSGHAKLTVHVTLLRLIRRGYYFSIECDVCCKRILATKSATALDVSTAARNLLNLVAAQATLPAIAHDSVV